MARVIRLTEQELKGLVTDLIKMALGGGGNKKETPKDQSPTTNDS